MSQPDPRHQLIAFEESKEPRGWVKRLGVYLRIFGNRHIGDGQVDYLIKKAQEREVEFGGD